LNTEKYISSGIIETYVLGLASDKEAAEVEVYAAQYPEIKAELAANRKALETYVLKFGQQPSASLKDAIFEKLSKESPTVEMDINEGRSSFGGYWLAASVILLVCSGMLNFYLFNNLQNTKGQLADLVSQNQKMAQENTINKANYELSNEKLAILSKPGNKTIELKGLAIAPESKVLVHFNPTNSEVFISIANLPRPPAGKQYQFWAIVDGKPVDGGMLSLNATADQIFQMKNFTNAQAFAISLEKEGGVTSPTMEAIYVMGNV
jgi:anti-sigma-K factor RskA